MLYEFLLDEIIKICSDILLHTLTFLNSKSTVLTDSKDEHMVLKLVI